MNSIILKEKNVFVSVNREYTRLFSELGIVF